jgi:Tol biopolymer transport system component
MSIKRVLLACTAVALVVVLALASTVSAKPFGGNGQIAFDRNSGESLHVINTDGSGETRLFDHSACCPKWSPDGTRIVTPALTEDGRFTSATFNPDGSGLVLLPNPEPGLNADGGVWSPDGAWLAVGGWDDNDPTRNGLYLRRSSGEGPLRRLTDASGGRDQHGDFSPDGSRIVFLRTTAAHKGAGALFVVNTDGSNVVQITPWGMAGCCTASWSPDGQWILFDARGKLYVVHPEGTGLRQVRLNPGGRYFAFEPAWAPDGKRMVFSMYVFALGQDDIYTADRDGSDLFQVTNTPEHEGQADWGVHQP